jgi:hypothetical protein
LAYPKFQRPAEGKDCSPLSKWHFENFSGCLTQARLGSEDEWAIALKSSSAQDSFFFQERVSHLSRMEARELGVVTSGTFFTKHVAMFPPNAICLVGKDVI